MVDHLTTDHSDGTCSPAGAVRILSADGIAGEVVIEPSDLPKIRGAAGLSGISAVPQMSREEHLEAMRSGHMGSFHSWELVTAVDGPGTRATFFLSGCPLRCLYCHNPDTFKMREGTPVMADDLLERINRYRTIFNATGGGVTLSGGEALMQAAFVERIFVGCHERNIHTCLDTSGFLGAHASDTLLDNTDLVLLDIKAGDPHIYQRLTSRPLEPTITFGHRLAQASIPVWVRFVHVPSLTDDKDNISKIIDIISPWDNIERVEVLPFHKMGEDKWKKLGYAYELSDIPAPSKDEVEASRDLFREAGYEVY